MVQSWRLAVGKFNVVLIIACYRITNCLATCVAISAYIARHLRCAPFFMRQQAMRVRAAGWLEPGGSAKISRNECVFDTGAIPITLHT